MRRARAVGAGAAADYHNGCWSTVHKPFSNEATALGRTSRVWDALFANERASGGVDGRAGLFFSGCGGGDNFGRGRERLSPTTLIKIGWPRGRAAAQHFKGFRPERENA